MDEFGNRESLSIRVDVHPPYALSEMYYHRIHVRCAKAKDLHTHLISGWNRLRDNIITGEG